MTVNEPENIILGKLLKNKKATISTAESCTGGNIAHQITLISGSSDYFRGGIVSYCNEIKESVLGVSHATLEKYSAVSEQTAKEMAENVRKKFHTDYGISTTGIAGPGGGNKENPVGTIWIGISSEKGTSAKKYTFGTEREENIKAATKTAIKEIINLLYEE